MRFRRAGILLTALIILCVSAALGDETLIYETDWYRQGMVDSIMRVGNNARLKRVIERAMNGEQVTLATIGGSITEGAGSGIYELCWAYRFRTLFGSSYGTDNGSNVALVNAGVGGTPSTFGYMRYRRDVVERVPATDMDGLPDVVVIEFSVNDWNEPTNHRCFESMVKEILDAPNEPAVILLFAVFRNGFNLQDELRKIGDNYDLMMVSIKDGFYKHIGKKLKEKDFFFDDYHPTPLGHEIMTDCLMRAIRMAWEENTGDRPDTNVAPVYGTDFLGLKTIYGDRETGEFRVERSGFPGTDEKAFRNGPVGVVCGKNFFHDSGDPMEPLRISGMFRKCLVAWRATDDPAFGKAEVVMDGRTVMTLEGGEGKWGQSEVVLALDDSEAAEHTLEIRVTEEGKKFTITAVGLQ